MEVLGDFAFDGIMEENSVGLVRMGDFLLLLSGGDGFQWNVLQAAGAFTRDGDYNLVVF